MISHIWLLKETIILFGSLLVFLRNIFVCYNDVTNPAFIAFMEGVEFIRVITILLPIFSALICGLLTLLSYFYIFNFQERKMRKIAMCYFFTSSFNWLNLLFSDYFYDFLFVTHTLWCVSILINPVLLYGLIRNICQVGDKKIDLYFCYVLPFITGVFIILLLFSQYVLKYIAGSENFYFFSLFQGNSFPIVIIISLFGSFYMLGGLWLIYCSYKNKSIKIDTSYIHRRYIALAAICIVLLLMPPMWFFIKPAGALYTGLTFLLTSLLSFFHLVFVVSLISKPVIDSSTFVQLPDSLKEVSVVPIKEVSRKESSDFQLNKKSLNQWVKSHKPYLRADLKLEEMAEEMGVTSKELSHFINRQYSLNFNQYLNKWRIAEIHRLQKTNRHKKVLLSVLIQKAGFGSVASYARAKAESINRKKDNE